MAAKATRKPKAEPAKRRKRKPDDPEQSERFKKAARDHEADESGEWFEEKLSRLIGRQK